MTCTDDDDSSLTMAAGGAATSMPRTPRLSRGAGGSVALITASKCRCGVSGNR